jgi:hypothetical protein
MSGKNVKRMIKLVDILKEISLGTPYRNKFNWEEGFLTYSTEFPSDSTSVKVLIDGLTSDPGEYELSFSTKNSTGKWNVSKVDPWEENPSPISIPSSEYLKILSTVGEALIDFLTKYSPKALEIAPWDTNPNKKSQKEIIYKSLFQSNASKINNIEYNIEMIGDRVRLTRKEND